METQNNLSLEPNSIKYYIYAYYIKDELMYVGRSKTPYLRYLGHISTDGVFKEVDRVDIAELNSDNEAEFFEKYYISILKPKLNIVGKTTPLQDQGVIHKFTSYNIEDFKNHFMETDSMSQSPIDRTFVYKGTSYKSQTDFIRKHFQGYKTRKIRYLVEKITKQQGCTVHEAYDYIFANGVDTLFRDGQDDAIREYILTNHEMKTRDIASHFNVTYDKIKKIREWLITEGLIPKKC